MSRISLPATTAESLRVETVVTGETREYFKKWYGAHAEKQARYFGDEGTFGNNPPLPSHHMYKTLAFNRWRYVQLVRALLKKDLVTLVEVDEVREHAEVFMVEKTGTNSQRLIICARVSNMDFLPPPGVTLVTSEGLSRVEVALGDNDEDPDELSKLAGLHLEQADVKDAFRRFKISKLYSSFFALPEVLGKEVGASSVGRVCPCFSSLPIGHTWSFFFCQNAIEEAMWATPGLEKAEILQDTWSCVLPRPSGGDGITKSSHQSARRFFHVYVDNLGVLGTSRVNVDRDLAMAVQTLRNRGLATHEEAFHSETTTALGIHIDLRNMLVSVAPDASALFEIRSALGITKKTWQVLLEHMTFVALLRPDVLSVPFILNKFIRASYNDNVAKCQSRCVGLCRPLTSDR